MATTTIVRRGGRPPAGHRAASGVRILAVLVAVIVAYRYSLTTLTRNLGLETPLAYLGLVPFMALLIALVLGRRPPDEPPIHDRQFDYILGLPLIVVALTIAYALPARLSTQFWTWRFDLLSLPLFVAGVVAIAFGARTLWRIRAAVVFLLLAWPVPYTLVLDPSLRASARITTAGVRAALSFVPVAVPVTSGDGSLFTIHHGDSDFMVSVAAACAGVNGIVGFVLVGAAAAVLVDGPRRSKLVWLALGVALLWLLNIVRILGIMATGARWGEEVAIEGLHPVLGLVTFNLGVVAMILAMPRFGLHFRQRSRTGGPEGPDDPSITRPPPPPPVPRFGGALVVVAITAGALAIANDGLADYQLVAGDLGEPRLVGFTEARSEPEGWNATYITEFTWGQRYFGRSSTWQRYTYVADGGSSPFRSPVPVTADVVATSDLNRLNTYGIEECYQFHDFQLRDVESFDLGGGITGTAVSYLQATSRQAWTTLYWHWNVDAPSGNRYERVVLMMQNTVDAELDAAPSQPGLGRRLGISLENATRSDRGDGSVDDQLIETRRFLVGFGQEIVRGNAALGEAVGRTRG